MRTTSKKKKPNNKDREDRRTKVNAGAEAPSRPGPRTQRPRRNARG